MKSWGKDMIDFNIRNSSYSQIVCNLVQLAFLFLVLLFVSIDILSFFCYHLVANGSHLHLKRRSKMKKIRLLIITALLVIIFFTLLFFGCAVDDKKSELIVAVTVLPQKTFAEAVCGDLATVIAMVPPGYSPGNYQPTPMEIELFSDAKVYFTIGVPTEKANILPYTENMKIVDLAKEVSSVYPDRQFPSGGRDPHIWLSPKRVKIIVETIAFEMGKLDEENAGIYTATAKQFIEKLDKLDANIKQTFSDAQNKTFITFHPSYGYIADDYGLEMIALEQDGKQATPLHLQETIDIAKQKGIKVIFSQAQIDSKQPDAFAEEVGGEKIMLNPLSEDYINNLESIALAIASAIK